MFKKIILAFIIWKTVLFLFVYLATFLLPLNPQFTPYKDLTVLDKRVPYSLTVWANFDGIHYIQIAQRGYQLLEQPFFPLYPLTMRFLTTVSGLPYILSSQIVANLSFLVFLLLLGKLLKLDGKPALFNTFLVAIILFPTSFFYGAAYNDALFLLLASACLYLGRKKRWFWSSVAASLATLTRLNGLALVFFILFEYLTTEGKKAKIYWLILPLFSFLGYLYWVQHAFKNWRLVFTTMQIWGQEKLTFPLQVFWRYLKILVSVPAFQLNWSVALLELVFVLFYLFLIIYSFRKIRLSYWVFLVVSLIIPSLTGTFQGMPRYGLHLYPLFLALAMFVYQKSLPFKLIVALISLGIMFFCLTLFTRGYFIA